MNGRRTVLLVHSDLQKLGRLSQALASEYDVLPFPSPETAIAELNARDVDYVVAEGREDYDDFLEKVEARSVGALKVLLPSSLALEKLVDTLRRGHSFVVLSGSDQTQEIVSNFKQVAGGRKTARHVLTESRQVALRATIAGQPVAGLVHDLSNRGVSFDLIPEGLEALLPGATLSDVSLSIDGAEFLTGASAIIRRLSLPDPAPEGSQAIAALQKYRIAIELFTGSGLPEQNELLSNVVQVAALLREGLRRSGLQVQAADELGELRVYTTGEVQVTKGLLEVNGPAPSLDVGDVARITFALGETSYSFFGAVLARVDSALTLKLPRTLRATRRRFASRFRPPADQQLRVRFRSPFTRKAIQALALDVSAHGVSVLVNPDRDIVPVGTFLTRIRLHFQSGRTTFVAGRVRSLVSMGTGPSGEPVARCSIAFSRTGSGDQVDLAEDLVRLGLPSLQDAAGKTSFQEIWSFLSASGFLYPKKLKQLEPVLPLIEKNMSRLLAEPSPIFKTVLFRKDDQLGGHLSAVRIYRRTWLVQHLAAARDHNLNLVSDSFSPARALSLGIASYLEQLPDFDWAKLYFRPDNQWPARVFGTFARRLRTPNLSELRTLHYCVMAAQTIDPALARRYQIGPASDSDLRDLERLFVSRGQLMALQSEDLCEKYARLPELSALYHRFDLERRREILVAKQGGRPIGFSLLEITSPGLNLSELTNTFRVYQWQDADSDLRRALIGSSVARYLELGYPSSIGLAEPVELADFEALGMQHSKDYVMWTSHRSLWRSFYEYILRLFGRFRPRDGQAL